MAALVFKDLLLQRGRRGGRRGNNGGRRGGMEDGGPCGGNLYVFLHPFGTPLTAYIEDIGLLKNQSNSDYLVDYFCFFSQVKSTG